MHVYPTPIGMVVNFAVTCALWVYYILGYLVFFAPFYLVAYFFSTRREEAFQRLNHRLHRLFFTLVRILIPRVAWRIPDDVLSIRSSVIIANHQSFLDPILFVSLFPRQKTIVRSDFFRVPVFGWILKTSGYMPSMAAGLFTEDMLDQLKNMRDYLAEGGNLFIFPEGTRSRSGFLGPFDKGTFRIAKLCRAPIAVLVIRNTGRLFPPDRFLFDTREQFTIELVSAGSLRPDYDSETFSLPALMAQVRTLIEQKVTS